MNAIAIIVMKGGISIFQDATAEKDHLPA